MSTTRTLPGAAAAFWPTPETVVLRSRTLREAPGVMPLSRFSDPVWHLGHAQLDDQSALLSENWETYPVSLRDAFKVFGFVALDTCWPAALQPALVEEQPELGTIHKWLMSLRVFAKFLDARGIARLCDIRRDDLEVYRSHVLQLPGLPSKHAHLLQSVRALWAYRDRLPEECRIPGRRPWGSKTADQLAGINGRDSPYNKTPRVAPDTMDALLGWALRMIEDLGPDIREAFGEQRLLLDGRHPATLAACERYPAGSSIPGRIADYFDSLRQAGIGLPGLVRRGEFLQPDYAHIARMTGSKHEKIMSHKAKVDLLAEQYGLELEQDAYFLGTVTGRVHGRPWRARPIGVREVNLLVRLLAAACFIVICYLSGMRSGEVLQLRRGCVHQDEAGQYEIVGRASKGADHGPSPRSSRERPPWAIVGIVASTIGVLESLCDGDLLFPPSRMRSTTGRAQRAQSKPSGTMNDDVREFIDWVNEHFSNLDGTPAIPQDPTDVIYAGRFRRTLAYFVVRRPGGLAAAQLQYGHVRSKVTLSYAGEADTGWLEDVALEQLEMFVEQSGEDAVALEAGEHVSGPAAGEYRKRVGRAARFRGRVVNQVRNARRLWASAEPYVHHGLAMTCVWRRETAACREEREAAGLTVSEPDERLCRAECVNLAFTDRDIEQKRLELGRWEAASSDPLSPQPLRDRACAKANQLRALIENHGRSRPHPGSSADNDGADPENGMLF